MGYVVPTEMEKQEAILSVLILWPLSLHCSAWDTQICNLPRFLICSGVIYSACDTVYLLCYPQQTLGKTVHFFQS